MNVLGANVADQCLQAGLLDAIVVLVAPVLLGAGTPLWRRASGTNIRRQVLDGRRTGLTSLWFRVPR